MVCDNDELDDVGMDRSAGRNEVTEISPEWEDNLLSIAIFVHLQGYVERDPALGLVQGDHPYVLQIAKPGTCSYGQCGRRVRVVVGIMEEDADLLRMKKQSGPIAGK